MDEKYLVAAAIALLLIMILSIGLYSVRQISAIKRKLNALEEVSQATDATVHASIKSLGHQINEDRERQVVLGKHQTTLQETLTNLENQLRELKQQDPSLRLYHRATELVKQGASLEEIIQSCDIPRAEAELLISMHRR
ncbi:DUF2802 domain-containing protein [Alteromonas sp. ASW11-130]|uniref:DUF2802 domain-containing protein n=1 Tax=Alteromonas sp. ASW11-130 TaxID=3015775 RepID=UPI00224210BB|nr:DUF2802 domain-containing protein [Alteromonas sp. ASW11-130]MCW8092851.1 DUF2802 domain-containing protein [Alteromonas sp. ASW11-130]